MDLQNLSNGMETDPNSFPSKEFIQSLLRTGPCHVKFFKADGSIRDMKATLDPSLLPTVEESTKEKRTKTPNPNSVSVWDLDKQSWRSFKIESLIGITY